MMLGHFAAGFAAKRFAPKVSLGTALLAAQFMDLLWPLLVLAGLEHVHIDLGNTAVTPLDFIYFPISHSLAGSLIWAAAAGTAIYAVRRRLRGALILAGAVMSHWVLDFISHRPDLPLGFASARVGLGLWYSVAATVAVELALFATGIWLYLRTTTAKDRTGSVAFWSGLALMLIIYVANIIGPPPPSVDAVAIAGNLSWLFVAWGYWVDRHRTAAEPRPIGVQIANRTEDAPERWVIPARAQSLGRTLHE